MADISKDPRIKKKTSSGGARPAERPGKKGSQEPGGRRGGILEGLPSTLSEIDGCGCHDGGCRPKPSPDRDDITIDERVYRLEFRTKKLFELFLLLKDAVNKMSDESKIAEVARILAESSTLFYLDEEGKLQFNFDDSLTIRDDTGALGVDYDGTSISLSGNDEAEDLKLGVYSSEWYTGE